MNKDKDSLFRLAAIATIATCAIGAICALPPAIVAMRQLQREFTPIQSQVRLESTVTIAGPGQITNELSCKQDLFLPEAQQSQSEGNLYLPVPEGIEMSPNQQVDTCLFSLDTGAPVAHGAWLNGSLKFPMHDITRVDGNVTIMSVVWPSRKTYLTKGPAQFLDPDPRNETTRGLIAREQGQFEGVTIYQHDKASPIIGASAVFHLSSP